MSSGINLTEIYICTHVLVYIWQTTLAPDVASVTHGLSRSNPVLAPDELFWRPFRFWKTKKNEFTSIKQTLLEPFLTTFVSYFFPASWSIYILFWPFKKQAPKPLLGCQNWVISMGGCKPNSQRRGPAWSVICRQVNYFTAEFHIKGTWSVH